MKTLLLVALFAISMIQSVAQEVPEPVSDLMSVFKREYVATYELAYNLRRSARVELNEKYLSLLKSYLSETDAQKVIDEFYLKKYYDSNEAKYLELSEDDRKSFARLKYEYEMNQGNIDATATSVPSRLKQSVALEQSYMASVLTLLGDTKYELWLAYLDGGHRRFYKSNYGFTDAQYDRYVKIENEYSIRRVSINSRPLTRSEKNQEIEKVDAERLNKVKELLSADQYLKWYEVYLVNEAYRKSQK